jgi:hypothetical protein
MKTIGKVEERVGDGIRSDVDEEIRGYADRAGKQSPT